MEVKLLHENLKSVFLIVFLETQPCIVMNCGMCRINKGARLKPADICPNLYFFTSTIFHRILLFRMLKSFTYAPFIPPVWKDFLSSRGYCWSCHLIGSYPCHFISWGHIHVISLLVISISMFLLCPACKVSWQHVEYHSFSNKRLLQQCIWWITHL